MTRAPVRDGVESSRLQTSGFGSRVAGKKKRHLLVARAPHRQSVRSRPRIGSALATSRHAAPAACAHTAHL